MRPSTVSSTRNRYCTDVPAPHLAWGSRGFTETRTTGAGARDRAFAFVAFALAAESDFTLDVGLLIVLLAPFDFLPGFLTGRLLDLVSEILSDFLLDFLLAFTLRTPVTAAVFLTFATSSPRLCNGRRVVSGSFR